MTLTRIQTVDISYPGTHHVFKAMLHRPVAPRNTPIDRPFRIRFDTHSTAWWDDGTIESLNTSGVRMTWCPVPVLADAIQHVPNSGTYFRFKSSGAIEAFAFGSAYYFCPPEEMERPEDVDPSRLDVLDIFNEWQPIDDVCSACIRHRDLCRCPGLPASLYEELLGIQVEGPPPEEREDGEDEEDREEREDREDEEPEFEAEIDGEIMYVPRLGPGDPIPPDIFEAIMRPMGP